MKVDVHIKFGEYQTAVCIEYNAASEAEFKQAEEFASLFIKKSEKKERAEDGNIDN